jgi:hypothetical protein
LVTSARYRPVDLLRDPARWGQARAGDWRPPVSVEEAARVVVATEHERLAAAIRRRLAAEGHSVPDLAAAIAVGYRQLMAKLNGEVALRAEELVAWQWLLGEHRSIKVPRAELSLSNFTRSEVKKLKGLRWPFAGGIDPEE